MKLKYLMKNFLLIEWLMRQARIHFLIFPQYLSTLHLTSIRFIHHPFIIRNRFQQELDAAGIGLLPRLNELNNGRPQFENGSVLDVSSIIWATGYRPDFSWIEMNVTYETGWPMTKRGISPNNNGLYFIGMPFQFGLTSGLVGGVGRHAEYISRHILRH